jgi:hypothetical protein
MRLIEKSEFTAETQRRGEDQRKNLPRINTGEAHRKKRVHREDAETQRRSKKKLTTD